MSSTCDNKTYTIQDARVSQSVSKCMMISLPQVMEENSCSINPFFFLLEQYYTLYAYADQSFLSKNIHSMRASTYPVQGGKQYPDLLVVNFLFFGKPDTIHFDVDVPTCRDSNTLHVHAVAHSTPNNLCMLLNLHWVYCTTCSVLSSALQKCAQHL